MLLHHRNWPVLPPNGRAQGQPGAGVDPLSDGTGVAPAHVPTLPAATSAFNLTLCHPICPLSPVLGLHCVWELGPQGLYYSNHQSLSWRNSIRQTKQILSPPQLEKVFLPPGTCFLRRNFPNIEEEFS